MTLQAFSRRRFIQRWIYSGGLTLVMGVVFSGCGQKESSSTKEDQHLIDPCDDLTGISETDIKLRGALGYVKKSPVADSRCDNCKLWLPPAKDAKCGRCLLFKGPVDPAGYCTTWAPKI